MPYTYTPMSSKGDASPGYAYTPLNVEADDDFQKKYQFELQEQQKIKNLKQQSDEAAAQAASASSLGGEIKSAAGTAASGFKGIPGAFSDVGDFFKGGVKQAASDIQQEGVKPVARAAGKGLFHSIVAEPTRLVEKNVAEPLAKVFDIGGKNAAREARVQAAGPSSVFQKLTALRPGASETEKAAYQGFDFAGQFVPYAILGEAAGAGIVASKIPGLVSAAGKLTEAGETIGDIASFAAYGQLQENADHSPALKRLERLGTDIATVLLFRGAGKLYRTVFRDAHPVPAEGEGAREVSGGAEEAKAQPGAVSAVTEGAEGGKMGGKSPQEMQDEVLSRFEKESMAQPDVLKTTGSNGKDLVVQARGFAKDDLVNSIKGARRGNFKIVKTLGKDAAGEPVNARYEVSKDGSFTIYATNKTSATQLAHELGHQYDRELTQTMDKKFSSMLPNFTRNKQAIEDTLTSFAVERKGGNASSADINAEVRNLVKALPNQIEELSAARRGGEAAASNSEKFADAVAMTLTKPKVANKAAPDFVDFIDHAQRSGILTPVSRSAEDVLPQVAKPMEVEIPKQEPGSTNVYNVAKGGGEALPEPQPQVVKEKIVMSPFAGTGKKTGRTVTTESFNPASIDAPEDVERVFAAAGKEAQVTPQRVAKSNEDIRSLSKMVGLTEDDLLKRKPGSIANAETVTKARQLVLDKASSLLDTIRSVNPRTASKMELQAVKDDFLRLVSMQKSVAGLRTEASNVFRSLGIPIQPGENDTFRELLEALQGEGKDLLPGSEKDIQTFAQNVGKKFGVNDLTPYRRAFGKYISTWYASILSGPDTIARIATSLSSNGITEMAAKAANPTEWKELPAAVSGWFRGLYENGIPNAIQAFKGEGAEFEGGFKRISPFENAEGERSTFGKIVESVGRIFNAKNAFFRAGAAEMEKASLAARGDQIAPDLVDAISKAYAERTVFQGRPTGKVVNALAKSAEKLRSELPESRVVVPFVRIVSNVLDRQFDYLPVFSELRLRNSVIDRQVENIVAKYGIDDALKAAVRTGDVEAVDAAREALVASKKVIFDRLRSQQIGRMVLGTGVAGGAIALAKMGRISGNGPSNAAEFNELMRTGWRPDSIKIGSVWIPFTHLGPLAGILAAMGNIHDKMEYDKSPTKDAVSLFAKGMGGWMHSTVNMSFLRGVAELFSAIEEKITWEQFFKNTGAGIVPIPAAYTQIKDKFFTQKYETQTIVDALRAKLGLTGSFLGAAPLEEKLNQFGEPIQKDFINQLTPKVEVRDRVDNFLVANDLAVTKPFQNQQYAVPGTRHEKRALMEEEYHQYIMESGQEIYHELDRRVPYYERLNPDEQKKQLQDLTRSIRERVRQRIMIESERAKKTQK